MKSLDCIANSHIKCKSDSCDCRCHVIKKMRDSENRLRSKEPERIQFFLKKEGVPTGNARNS